IEKPHALAAKLGAILGDKVIRNWKWLQTTILRADRARGATSDHGTVVLGVSVSDYRGHLTRGSTYRLESHRPWSRRRHTVTHTRRPVIERLGSGTVHTCQARSARRRRLAALRTCTASRLEVS